MQYIMPKRKEDKLKSVPEIVTEEAQVGNRTAARKLSAQNVNAMDIDGVLTRVFEIIGITDTTIISTASPAQVDLLASELIAVRDAKDLIEGRETALKDYASSIINYRIAMEGENPDEKSGFLVSPENGIKLSKEVSGGKLNVDVNVLKTVLDEVQFKSVTNKISTYKTVEYADGSVEITNETTYEINEEELEKQLSLGTVGMEQIVKAALPGKTRTALYVRKLK